MKELMRRAAVAYFAGALAALAVVLVAWILGRAELGPVQREVDAFFLLERSSVGALCGLLLVMVLGRDQRRAVVGGAVLGLAFGLHAWHSQHPWPLGGSPLVTGGYWLMWGAGAGWLASWLRT